MCKGVLKLLARFEKRKAIKRKAKMKTNFIHVMGDSPINRVLDFLIENDRESWTMVEIRDEANVGYSTLKIILPEMLKKDLIIVSKIVGKSRLFKINKNNIVTKKIYELYNAINENEIKRFIKV